MNDLVLKVLEDYLDGQLPMEEQLRLEERLAAEEELREQLQWLKDVRQVAVSEEELRLKKLLQQSTEQSAKVFHLEKWAYAAAAAAVLLIAIGIWWFNRSPQPDLFAAHFEPYPNVSVPIERSQPIDNLKLRAFQSYEGENYTLAALQLDSLLQLENNDAYLFYYGNALLASKQYSTSINKFHQLSQNNFSDFQTQAEWYLALNYYKLGNEAMAKTLFEKISVTEGHVFQQQARDLLSKQ